MLPRRALLTAPLATIAAPALAAGGDIALSDTPALAAHRAGFPADNPDLILRWNAPAPGPLDLVLHFHGFADGDSRRLDLRAAMEDSGLDLVPIPEAQSRHPGRATPTLAMLPRGRPNPTERRPGAFDWPAIAAPGGLAAILATGMAYRGATERGRLILTAHSGGGGGLLATLDQCAREGLRVDQVHCFDALYRDPAPLIHWARRTPLSTLVVLYVPGTRNEVTAREVAAAVPAARVQPSDAGHADIPRANGWRLLADSRAALI